MENRSATNLNEVLSLYDAMYKRSGKTFFISPLTEISVAGNQAVVRFDQNLVDIKGGKRKLKAMVLIHFDQNCKIDRFVELANIKPSS